MIIFVGDCENKITALEKIPNGKGGLISKVNFSLHFVLPSKIYSKSLSSTFQHKGKRFSHIVLRMGSKGKYLLRVSFTGKYLSEALILASTHPQYDDRLFIELRVQYMKITSSELGWNVFCENLRL